MSKATASVGNQEITIDRRREDRRKDAEADTTSAVKTGHRKAQRRRQIDPTTCERDYNEKEIEFMHALDAYKRSAGRMFPTCSEVLEVIRSLGYVQLTEEQAALLQSDEFDDEFDSLDDHEDSDLEEIAAEL
ncbi:MAG: hypothetical protein R3C05_17840 [Pirellulaceae bacterium]